MARLDNLDYEVNGVTTNYEIVPEIAPLFNATTAYAAGDQVIQGGVRYKFTTAHPAGAWIGTDAEEMPTVADELTELKNDLTSVNNTIDTGYRDNPPVANGSFNAAGAGNLTVRSDRIRTDFIQLKAGDKIEIDNGTLKHAVGGWSATIGSGTNIRNDSQFTTTNETIVAEVESYYVVVFAKQNTSQSITPSDFDGYIHVFADEIYRNTERLNKANDEIDVLNDTIESAITSVDVPVYENTTVSLTNTTGSVIANGTIETTGNYANNQYSQKIPVSAGDILTPVKTGETAYFRFVCAYNGNNVAADAGTNSGTYKYTVPQGIDGVIVSIPTSQNVSSVNKEHQTGTITKVFPNIQKLGYINWKGSLLSGDSVELLASNVRYNVVWNFTGHITTMGKITLGIKNASGTIKELCSVDATKVYYRLNDGTIANEAHGLTISEDLQIKIDSSFKVNELGGITICSDGTEYNLSTTTYGTDMTGVPYLASDGAVMTDCAFSWIPKDIDKPIWVFGDSWVSMYDSRWPYYMVRDGYTNSWMLNGFAGEDSDEALESFKNLLTIRKPDYLVWMLGMNNGDTGGAVNSVWKAVYDELTEMCEEYNIELILYTVPNTPTIDNSYKNAIVTASGYRYIDGVAAVGDDGSGNWFTGYEQSPTDHNHTSAKGAKALFHRILGDFPEIAGNGI